MLWGHWCKHSYIANWTTATPYWLERLTHRWSDYRMQCKTPRLVWCHCARRRYHMMPMLHSFHRYYRFNSESLSRLLFFCGNVNVSVNQKFFSVARIAELSRSPRRRSRVTELYWETIDEKGMFLDVVGRRADTEMIGCQMAMSSRWAMQRLENSFTFFKNRKRVAKLQKDTLHDHDYNWV